MNLNDGNEMLALFNALYSQEEEANDIKREVADNLKSYAEQIGTDAKNLKAAYTLYKKYASGKNFQDDCDDYAELSEIVTSHFAM